MRKQIELSDDQINKITEKQITAAILLSRGYSMEEAAKEMNISTATLKTRLTELVAITNCNTHVHLIATMIFAKLID